MTASPKATSHNDIALCTSSNEIHVSHTPTGFYLYIDSATVLWRVTALVGLPREQHSLWGRRATRPNSQGSSGS